MTSVRISCAHALVDHEWHDDVVLGLDEVGMILDVRQHQGESPGKWLSGFVVPGMSFRARFGPGTGQFLELASSDVCLGYFDGPG